MIGRTISHFRIEEKLGEGGMGVVYRARDLALPRSVAIKFLAPELATDVERRRFEHEAQTASSLNHPQIVAVYEAGVDNGDPYLVTEYVDGPTLREWVRRTRPSVRQILEVMIGIADALACAHEAGIVHRDIKPENILVSRQGHAKLTDFGVAKLVAPESEREEATRTATRAGVIVGTAPYMSPEQLHGIAVDARSDIFSFGTVLYQLLAGQRPFAGTRDLELVQAILHSSPRPLSELRPDTSQELRFVVDKALEKDSADRYQSMRELVVDLKRALRRKGADAEPTSSPPSIGRRSWWLIGASTLALLFAAAAIWQRNEAPWQNPFTNARFERLTDFEGLELDAAISADGKFVTFLSDRDGPFDAFVTQVGSGEFLNLTKGQTPEMFNEVVGNVGFSADGAHVWTRVGKLVSPGRPVPESLWLIPTLGGAARLFLDSAVMAAWSPDGSKVAYHEATPGDAIHVADRNGSNPRQIFVDSPGYHCHFLTWSPDARFIYFVRGFPLDEMDVWRIPATGGVPERISHHNSRVAYPVFLNDRTLIYVATADDGTGPWLYAMDLERRAPQRVNVSVERYISIAASAASPGRPRRLVASVSNPSVNLWTVPISDGIADESDASRFAVPTARSASPRFGHDYLVYLAARGDADGLWKFKDGKATELWRATDGAVVGTAAVSTDGRQVCFPVGRQGRTTAYCTTADGTNARQIAESLDIHGPVSWSPDGKWIAVTASLAGGGRLFKVPVDGGPPVRLVDSITSNPVWSPDGTFILYSGPQIGRNVQVKAVTPEGQPYPLPELWLSRIGENYRFMPGGKQLVLMQGGFRRQNLWLLDLTTGRQRQLTNLQPGSTLRSFDISADGKQILFDRVRENSDIVVIELPEASR